MAEMLPSIALRLDPMTGPPIEPILVEGAAPLTLGRSGQSDLRLMDESVSRQHAQVAWRGDGWYVADLGSRHGTFVNAMPLAEGERTLLRHGDLLRLGPWTFRAVLAGESRDALSTTDDLGQPTQRVEAVAVNELASLAKHRLDLLIECAGAINTADDEVELADLLLDAALRGTGFQRAALIRELGDQSTVEVIGYRSVGRRGRGTEQISYSRSLVVAASQGQIARLTTDSTPLGGESIVSLGIHSALCAPMFVGQQISGYLYLDSRGGEASVQPDAAAFCEAITRMGGLALANLRRQELEQHQQQVERDLEAARRAQGVLLPSSEGTMCGVRYAMVTHSGRFVAGDLFDVIGLSDGRVGVLLGDVTGKGIGAAILMAMAQTHVGEVLRQTGDPAAAVSSLNRLIAARWRSDKFVTLWVGVFDTGSGELTFVDAGHGHWLVVRGGEAAVRQACEGGLLVGVDSEYAYENERMSVGGGDRVVVFSDGVVEQQSTDGEPFGMPRAVAALRRSSSSAGDVEMLLVALREHAGGEELADDTTVASVEVLSVS